MYELVYTSTPQGLITGRSGFTTVALTDGFPPNLIAPVENLSGYKPLYTSGDVNENCNPVNYSCQHFRLGRTNYIVLSKISYAGLSYTGRSNVLAHHLLFLPEELDEIPGGAVSVLRAEENFPPWSGEPRMLRQKGKIAYRPLPQGGDMWQKLAGDALWKDYTAECFNTNPEKGFALAFDPLMIKGTDILDLIAETAAAMSKEELRKFTFSTYSYLSGISNPAFIRSYVIGSVQLDSIKRLDPKSVVCLGERNVLPASWIEQRELARAAALRSQGDETFEIHTVPLNNDDGYLLKPEDTPPVNTNSVDFSPAAAPQDDRKEDSEVQETVGKNRKLLIMIPVILGLLFLCGAVFWRVCFDSPSQTQTTSDEEIIGQPVTAADKQPLTVKQRSPGESKPVILPERKPVSTPVLTPPVRKTPPVTTPRKDSVPAVRTKPEAPVAPPRKAVSPRQVVVPGVSVVPADRKKTAQTPKNAYRPRADFGKLTSQEIYRLYLSIYRGTDYTLSPALRSATGLVLKIHSIGGLPDISGPNSFVSGNRSKKVVVYARRSVRSEMMAMSEWVPDKTPASQMLFQLMPNNVLRIRFPAKKTDMTPVTDDITRITFLQKGGKSASFLITKLPSCIDRILNKKKDISIQRTSGSILYWMQVPDDLWTFRKFYNISVDGRNFGDINTRKILLRQLNLEHIQQISNARNKELRELRNAEKAVLDYKKRNWKNMQQPPPPTRIYTALQKEMEPGKLKTLKDTIDRCDDKTWKKQLDDIKGVLQASQNKIKDEDSRNWLAGLDDYRRRCIDCRRRNNVYVQLQQKVENHQQKVRRSDQTLQENMQRSSSALYRLARGYIDGSKPLPPDFFGSIQYHELVKDIKVEIIRKGH